MPPMPAPPPPSSVSCHKGHSATTDLRTLCNKTPSFAHFQSKTDRELTATASCYESPCQYPVTSTKENFSKRDRSGRNRAFRYPIDTLSIPDFRKIRSRFASHPDAFRPKSDRIGPTLAHLRGAADKETDAATDSDPDFDPDFGTRRQCGPRRGPLLARKSGRLHPCRRRIRCRKPPFSSGRIRSTCPAPTTTFGRCSLTAPGYQANNGANDMPGIPVPQIWHAPDSRNRRSAARNHARANWEDPSEEFSVAVAVRPDALNVVLMSPVAMSDGPCN